MKEHKELEDLFLTEEFKSLPWSKRLWVRIRVAFIATITTF